MKEVHIIFEGYDDQAEIRKWPIEIVYSSMDAAETAFLELEEKAENEKSDYFYEIFTFPLKD